MEIFLTFLIVEIVANVQGTIVEKKVIVKLFSYYLDILSRLVLAGLNVKRYCQFFFFFFVYG